ncbi:MAG TPA: hypothetical protein V6D47_17495 [Oscillatoriaceae cyanobacterium]
MKRRFGVLAGGAVLLVLLGILALSQQADLSSSDVDVEAQDVSPVETASPVSWIGRDIAAYIAKQGQPKTKTPLGDHRTQYSFVLHVDRVPNEAEEIHGLWYTYAKTTIAYQDFDVDATGKIRKAFRHDHVEKGPAVFSPQMQWMTMEMKKVPWKSLHWNHDPAPIPSSAIQRIR